MRDSRQLTILHTNDFHNHFSADQASYVKQLKSESGTNTLLLDSGDAVSAGNVGVRIAGEPVLVRMSETGYDAMTMGNREFHIADGLLKHKIADASFPVLCANIRYQKEHSGNLPVVPYITKVLENGLKVIVIGVTVPMVTARMTARVISSYLFDDPVTTVAGLVADLRQDADVLIALTHIGHKEDLRLAESCQQLDLIVGGHSHVVLETAQMVGRVPVVQAGWFGHYIGLVTLEVGESQVHLSQSQLQDLRSTAYAGFR